MSSYQRNNFQDNQSDFPFDISSDTASDITSATPADYSQAIPWINPYQTLPGHDINGGIPDQDNQNQATSEVSDFSDSTAESFNFKTLNATARIAIYDNMISAPRVYQIPGAPTHQFIENIATATYQYAQSMGGMIPYTVIREVAENFIHAYFKDPIVSIFDRGNTIRFADQGPGIKDKDLVQKPGITSATDSMKRYIRGVGSGLPIVKEQLNLSHGTIKIEDNINTGSVITISLIRDLESGQDATLDNLPHLTENDREILLALFPDKVLGVTEVHNLTKIANGSIHASFTKLEKAGLLETKAGKKRALTKIGNQAVFSL